MKQLGEYSDPFDLKTTVAETEVVESKPDAVLPLADDDYSVPYEMKNQQQGKWEYLVSDFYNFTKWQLGLIVGLGSNSTWLDSTRLDSTCSTLSSQSSKSRRACRARRAVLFQHGGR